jgi:MerR family mercuric resistance operon transcriptional regulator
MTIGKAARAAGVGVETIRFYERKGLIEQPPKPLGSGYRIYPSETVARIRFIREAAGQLGFSLRETSELLALRARPEASASDVRARAVAKLDDVRARMARLQEIEASLVSLIDTCPGAGAVGGCAILDALAGPARKD